MLDWIAGFAMGGMGVFVTWAIYDLCRQHPVSQHPPEEPQDVVDDDDKPDPADWWKRGDPCPY